MGKIEKNYILHEISIKLIYNSEMDVTTYTII
jgi:hypothetical protein